MTTEQVIEILADIKEYYGERLDDRIYFGYEIPPLNDIEREATDKAIEAIDKAIEMLKELKGEAE